MITQSGGVFHIQTETYSYLFRANRYGLLEHLHFGTPVKTEDADAFGCRVGLGWGSNVLLNSEDTAS